jgi:hypothetical protein
MYHGPSFRTPARQQPRDLLFGIEIVARAPVGVIDRLLQINQQKN